MPGPCSRQARLFAAVTPGNCVCYIIHCEKNSLTEGLNSTSGQSFRNQKCFQVGSGVHPESKGEGWGQVSKLVLNSTFCLAQKLPNRQSNDINNAGSQGEFYRRRHLREPIAIDDTTIVGFHHRGTTQTGFKSSHWH